MDFRILRAQRARMEVVAQASSNSSSRTGALARLPRRAGALPILLRMRALPDLVPSCLGTDFTLLSQSKGSDFGGP
jgi:hypothetical protein